MDSELRNRKNNKKNVKNGNENDLNERVQQAINDEPSKKTENLDKNIKTKLQSINELTLKNNINNNNSNDISKDNDNNKKNIINNNNNNKIKCENNNNKNSFIINIQLDLITFLLFFISFITRFYKLSEPMNIVFDELHYGKYVSLYMKKTFFFDQHPPLGKLMIAGVAQLAGYNGNYTFSRIGADYTENVPVFMLRFLPAFCGSLLAPATYNLLQQAGLHRWTAILGSCLIILDNSLLTQSRFILMESMMLLFTILGLLYLLQFEKCQFFTIKWFFFGILASIFFTFAVCVKYIAFYSNVLGFLIIFRQLWNLLSDKNLTDFNLIIQAIVRCLIFTVVPVIIYMSIFYVHLSLLTKAGPHDSVMTSAFQASLEGGLASITKGQPLNVVHGSQVTLRHSLGRACWLHSHHHVYPIKYEDKRGSSHQQQVTCYSFKDVHNWWIVKRPNKTDLIVGDIPDPIKHGDEIQLVHGITSRALNSHDVAAPMSPQSQEVSCYIDYNISWTPQILWRVDIINKDQEGPVWHAIRSQVRLIHVTTGQALRYTGRQLPDWGFNQHEVVADKNVVQPDTIWNVEEHRYTKSDDQKERERQLLNAEMIPTHRTTLTFWDKFKELQIKMLSHAEPVQSHMYSSEPLDWPFMNKGIAYWVAKDSNAQIHLLGNIVIWYSGTLGLFIYLTLFIFYLLRRHRNIYDLNTNSWELFIKNGEIFFMGYLINYLPYFFIERTLFLHNYLIALIYKIFLLAFIIEHLYILVGKFNQLFSILFKCLVLIWLASILYVYAKFSVMSYGVDKLNSNDIINLRWKDTWDFILHKDMD